MLNLFPGPGVHAVRPETSMSHRFDRSVALPPIRQLMPITAMGSRRPLLPSSVVSWSLSTDHGDEENVSLPEPLLTVLDRDVPESLTIVIVLGGYGARNKIKRQEVVPLPWGYRTTRDRRENGYQQGSQQGVCFWVGQSEYYR